MSHRLPKQADVRSDIGRSVAAAIVVKIEPTEWQHNNTRREPVLLKPWTFSHHPSKTPGLAFDMLRDTCLFSLFKCMARNCGYATTGTAAMEKHLKRHHSKYFGEAMQCTDHLECAYCEVVEPLPKKLVEHIVKVHSNSPFQCQHCFYRSADAYSVKVHLSLYHKDKEAVILFCGVKSPSCESDLIANIMSKLKNETLKPIIVDGKCYVYIYFL